MRSVAGSLNPQARNVYFGGARAQTTQLSAVAKRTDAPVTTCAALGTVLFFCMGLGTVLEG